MRAGLVRLPRIVTPDGCLHLGSEIRLDESDLQAAGKAIGAIRAGHATLCQEAGIGYGDVRTVYMAGATGTYADPVKAQHLGLLPSRAKSVIQVGNTSLAMARALVADMARLTEMREMARRLRRDHCMLASSETFKKFYLLELAYWTEGMPMDSYRSLLARYGFNDLPARVAAAPRIRRTTRRDIGDPGRQGLRVLEDIGRAACRPIAGCTACRACVDACPQSALVLESQKDPPVMRLTLSRCAGVSCKRCERVCPEKVMIFASFFSD
jgi:methylamine methyltransferase corrinoid protein reductive activase